MIGIAFVVLVLLRWRQFQRLSPADLGGLSAHEFATMRGSSNAALGILAATLPVAAVGYSFGQGLLYSATIIGLLIAASVFDLKAERLKRRGMPPPLLLSDSTATRRAVGFFVAYYLLGLLALMFLSIGLNDPLYAEAIAAMKNARLRGIARSTLYGLPGVLAALLARWKYLRLTRSAVGTPLPEEGAV